MSPRFVTSADGTRIAVHESGNPGGPVLVAVHGYPDNHTVWDGVVAQLAGRFSPELREIQDLADQATAAVQAEVAAGRLAAAELEPLRAAEAAQQQAEGTAKAIQAAASCMLTRGGA